MFLWPSKYISAYGKQPMIISENIKDGDSVPRPTTLDGATVVSLDLSWDGAVAGANKAAICMSLIAQEFFLIFCHMLHLLTKQAYAWAYNLARKRWDLRQLQQVVHQLCKNYFQDSTGEIYYGDLLLL